MNPNTPRLSTNRTPNPMHQFRVKRSRHSNRLREHRLLERSHSMQAFPELQERDVETGLCRVEGLEGIVSGGVGYVKVVD